MKNESISLTPVSDIVQMTKALPEIPDGARPIIYEQVIPNAKDTESGQPDPAHIYD